MSFFFCMQNLQSSPPFVTTPACNPQHVCSTLHCQPISPLPITLFFFLSPFLLSLITKTTTKPSISFCLCLSCDCGFEGLIFSAAMDLINSVLNWVVPPASMVMLAFAWPALSFISVCEWVYGSLFSEDMEDKVVIITGASSGIGEVTFFYSLVFSPLF